MSLKASTFKDIKLNKYLGIVIILAFLSTTLVSLKLTHGQVGNLTVNQTNGLAQNQSQSSSNANVTGPHKLGVKITSPSKNATVPAGQLIIHGISSDTAITNCLVSTDWNDLKPMQNVTAKGPGGANDYSNWTYTYNESYHNITAGINELTSKITCIDDPGNITKKYFTINVTGS